MSIPGALMGIGAIALVLLAVVSPAVAAGWRAQAANQNSTDTAPIAGNCTGEVRAFMHRFQNTTAAENTDGTTQCCGDGEQSAFRFRWEHATQSGEPAGDPAGSVAAEHGPKNGNSSAGMNGSCGGDCTQEQRGDRTRLQQGTCSGCTQT